MTRDEMVRLFNEYGEKASFDCFKNLTDKPSSRADLCAFIMLDQLLPNSKSLDLVCCAEHDQIWLDVDLNELAKVVTERDVEYLDACGVWVDEDTDSLSMFV